MGKFTATTHLRLCLCPFVCAFACACVCLTGDRLARARQRLLDNHVRAYDPEKDRRHETCAICLDGWESGQEVHSFSPCNHLFHAKCIADWLRHRDTCPICRASWKEPTTV